MRCHRRESAACWRSMSAEAGRKSTHAAHQISKLKNWKTGSKPINALKRAGLTGTHLEFHLTLFWSLSLPTSSALPPATAAAPILLISTSTSLPVKVSNTSLSRSPPSSHYPAGHWNLWKYQHPALINASPFDDDVFHLHKCRCVSSETVWSAEGSWAQRNGGNKKLRNGGTRTRIGWWEACELLHCCPGTPSLLIMRWEAQQRTCSRRWIINYIAVYTTPIIEGSCCMGWKLILFSAFLSIVTVQR